MTAVDQPLPATASATSRENPWPVRLLNKKMAEYISRAPRVWVEGQIAQLNNRSTSRLIYLTLRDSVSDISLEATAFRTVVSSFGHIPKEGERVVVCGTFNFWEARGRMSLRIDEMHPVGIGELLARLERIRKLLAAEGLTDPRRKKPLPFLPHTVGLITGRDSAAESDVLTNARLRWPAVQFRVEHTPVQGATAVAQVMAALERLDADPEVDVIIIARGGGSMEDLLPFSDETLCRAVAACHTPVISAIGHEPDHPILDDVADVRCSTPTDAGKTVVPDAVAELESVDLCRSRMRRALSGWVETELARLQRLTSIAAMADPYRPLDERDRTVADLADRSLAALTRMLDTGEAGLARRHAQLAVLGPAATLARGYAVVQANNRVLQEVADAPAGTALRIRLADGALTATSDGPEQESQV